MDDGKIYITISDERSGDGVGGTSTPKKRKQKEYDYEDYDAVAVGEEYAKHRFYSFVQSEAKQMVGYAINNIGNFTGDYNTQRSAQTIQRVGSIALNIGMATVMFGGVGGIIATLTQGINLGLEYAQGQIQNTKQNFEINQLREISGLNALTNGSR